MQLKDRKIYVHKNHKICVGVKIDFPLGFTEQNDQMSESIHGESIDIS